MTRQEKVEQVICPLSYTTNSEYLTQMISEHQFGGIMFRARETRETQAALNAVQKASKVPIFTAANLEDGGNGTASDKGTYMGRQMDAFEADEIKAILAALESEPLKRRVLTTLLIATGARRGEIMGLQWKNVDSDNNRLFLCENRGLYAEERIIQHNIKETLINAPSASAGKFPPALRGMRAHR